MQAAAPSPMVPFQPLVDRTRVGNRTLASSLEVSIGFRFTGDGPGEIERQAASATRDWPTADQVARANPIYRMFGFDPNGAA